MGVIFWHVQIDTTVCSVFLFSEESGHTASVCTTYSRNPTRTTLLRRHFWHWPSEETASNLVLPRRGELGGRRLFTPKSPGSIPAINMGLTVDRVARKQISFEYLSIRPVCYHSTDDRIHSSTIRMTVHPLEAADPRCSLFPPPNNTVRSLARLVSMVLYIKIGGNFKQM